jgi:23S rRNA pseudouridine1911/1915/1917 synthase
MHLDSRVLYEDEHCLAVIKCAGQFGQGLWAPPGELTLEQEVRNYLRPGDPAGAYLGIVHRLDRPVSGVLLWAKTPKAARRLSAQFESRRVTKEYWAVVETHQGIIAAEGLWTDWLTRPGADGTVCAVEPGTRGSRPATTRYRVAQAEELPEGCVWLRLFPETGRTHQLRIQCARRGWPILGDSSYGATRQYSPGIALLARGLCLRHPMTSTQLELTAEIPEAWSEQGIRLPSTRP